MENIYDIFKNFAEQQPDKLFMFDEEKSFTADSAFGVIDNIAYVMYSAGVRSDDVVAIRSSRTIDTMFLFFAVQFLGAVACLTDPHSGVVDFIKDSGVNISPKWYITNEYNHSDINGCGNWIMFGEKLRLEIIIDKTNRYDAYPVCHETEKPAVVIFTSGSTGKSKGVVLSQRNLICHMYNYEKAGCFEPYDISIELLPVHHIFGLTISIYALFSRYCMFFPKNTDIDYVAECIPKYGITRMDGVPTYMLALAKKKEKTFFNSETLRTGLLGGAPSTKEQFYYIEHILGLKLVPVYGMSECVAITGIPLTEPAEKRAATVGKFLPMHDGFISDGKDGREATGIEGEICVKSPVVMLGYYGDKEATSRVIDKNGALHTGDIGFVDEEGYVHVTGRKKDIIIRNGVNISAAKIEKALLNVSYVNNAAVVAGYDERLGEIPCALIVLKNDEKRTGKEIYDDLKKYLTKNELPEKIIFSDKMPLTSSGKADKEKIKGLFNVRTKIN